MVPLDAAVMEWCPSMLLLWNGSARGCFYRMAPLKAASVKGLRNQRLLLWNYVCVEQCFEEYPDCFKGKANGVLIFWIWQIVVKVIE